MGSLGLKNTYLLQIHELTEQINTVGVLAQLILQIGKDVKETADRVPQATVGQRQLIAHARPLDVLGQRVEDLTGDGDGLAEVLLARLVHTALARVQPVEVHEGLLEPQQIVDGANDRVDYGRVAHLHAA